MEHKLITKFNLPVKIQVCKMAVINDWLSALPAGHILDKPHL